jgi:hypothetical protein
MDEHTAYRFEVVSLEGLIQQLQIHLKNGFYFYVVRVIPRHKDPRAVDAKLNEQYKLDVSKYVRSRRKKRGHFSVHCVRLDHLLVLMASDPRATPATTAPAASRYGFP